MELNARDCIVPIVGLSNAGGIGKFLGTVAFVGERNRILTAEHVVKNWDGDFGIWHSGCVRLAQLQKTDEARDLAQLTTASFESDNALRLKEESSLPGNEPVVCVEFGTTRVQGRQIRINPATRLGHVVRLLDQHEHGFTAGGDQMLELSFPALKGASGAPVLSNNGFDMLGMVIANVSYHLLPAQITTVYDEEGKIEEETNFMLPQALATNFVEIREFIETG